MTVSSSSEIPAFDSCSHYAFGLDFVSELILQEYHHLVKVLMRLFKKVFADEH
jgi:hypothetical protein